jgi:hypothetical protein
MPDCLCLALNELLSDLLVITFVVQAKLKPEKSLAATVEHAREIARLAKAARVPRVRPPSLHRSVTPSVGSSSV